MAEWGTPVNSNTATGPDQAFVVDNSEAGNMSILSNLTQASPTAGETAPVEGKDDQPRVVALRACLSCRRLKMKCTIESGPSCVRCIKAGRQCEFPQPGQVLPPQPRRRPRPQPEDLQEIHRTASVPAVSHPGINQIRHINHGSSPNSYYPPSWTPITPEPSTIGGPKKASRLPSAHSASPLATVVDVNSRPVSAYNATRDNEQPPVKRRRTAGHTPGAQDGTEESLSRRDMEQLLGLFKERMLSFITILGPEDFEDIPTMLTEQKPLVQCVCYVTARFVPGGSVITEKLFRPISDLLLGISEARRSTASESLALLKGLIVLYAYAQAVPSAIKGSQAPAKDLLYWRIKTFTEAHALQLFLHRSIEGLRASINAKEPQISKSYCYKMYTYWLWLYTMSHRGSLATRTPPSIRADVSIRAASKLLNEIGLNARVSRLLGEVELCLSWELASIQDTQLGEWWCQPEPRPSPKPSSRDLIDEVQATLNQWTHRWRDRIASDAGDYQGSDLDFHIRFTQFCITTYSIRPLEINEYGTDHLLPAQKEAIAECIKAASQVLVWALDLGPVSKDRLRYLGDFGFVMLSFCAFFILQASQAFGPAIPDGDEYFDTTEEAAQLMIELATDSRHAPAVYGKSILLLLKKFRDPGLGQSQIDGNNASQDSVRSRSGMISDTQGFVGHEPSTFVPDQIWGFTSLFPDMLRT